MKVLEFLKNAGFTYVGERVQVEEETMDEYWYYNRFDEWCYIPKTYEDTVFKVINIEERNNGRNG
jgi:hypothetical protein